MYVVLKFPGRENLLEEKQAFTYLFVCLFKKKQKTIGKT